MVNFPAFPFDIGDPVPPAILLDQAGGKFALRGNSVAGCPVILLASPTFHDEFARELRQFESLQGRFAEMGARVLPISGGSPSANAAFVAANNLALPILGDSEGRFVRAIAGDAVACLVIDQDLRLFARLPIGGGGNRAEQALSICQEIVNNQPRDLVSLQAPVLLVPRVLSPALCQSLIDHWAAGNKQEDVATSQYGVDPTAPPDPSTQKPTVKRRADWLIPDGPLNIELRDIFRRRLVPNLRKAFDFQPEAYETLRVGCYDAGRGGYFRRHRDNIGPPEIQRRRFAMSLNLNDDYDGGEVRFPEYGAQRYRPPMGAALVFSCSLLHEALDITRGRRFVLLTFFFGKGPAPDSAAPNPAA